jgi:U-box domain
MIAKINMKSKQMKATTPEAYICPLTKEIMIDPLMTRYGVSYERAAIVDHITTQSKPYCPKTKNPLSVRDLIPNYKLRAEIINYRREVLGEDTTTTNYCNDSDEDTIREVECIRAMMHAFSPPTVPKKRVGMKNILLRFSPTIKS